MVRWIDLLAALLRRGGTATFDELQRDVPAYGDTSRKLDARTRMFERDKDELRAFGVPIETTGDEVLGYRLRRTDFYLPFLRLAAVDGERRGTRAAAKRLPSWLYGALQELTFEPDELAAVGEAAARVRGIGDSALAAHAEAAIRKLALDLPLDPDLPGDAHVVAPRPRANRETLDTIGRALAARKRLTMTYHAMGRDEVAERTVEPWGLFFLGGHWYIAGRDPARGVARAGLRNFRVDRIQAISSNSLKRRTPDYEIPADFQLAEHARSRQAWELGDGEAEDVVIEFRSATGATLAASRLGAPVEGVGKGDPPRRRLRIRRRDAFLRWILATGGDVVPVSPTEVVDAWRDQLHRTRAVYAGVGAGAFA